jgi:hypothetical protein
LLILLLPLKLAPSFITKIFAEISPSIFAEDSRINFSNATTEPSIAPPQVIFVACIAPFPLLLFPIVKLQLISNSQSNSQAILT